MYFLVHKILVIIGDIDHLLSPAYKHPRRGRLLLDYLRIRIKASLNRWFHFTHDHFLSFEVVVPNYEIFFSTFRQVFIWQTYYLDTDEQAPNIIDCGGNIGMSVLYWKYLYPEAHVTVFEPSREVIGALEENIRRNKLTNVVLVNAAVSATDGTTQIYVRGNAACGNTLSDIIAETTPHKRDIDSYEVKTVRLSDFIQDPVDMLKLDIEGNEGVVFKELAEKNVLEKVKQISLEYHYSPQATGNSLIDILSIFKKYGFEAQIYSEEYENTAQLALEQHGVYAFSMRTVRRK